MCTYNHIGLLNAFLRKSSMVKVRPDNISKNVMYYTSRDFHHKIRESYDETVFIKTINTGIGCAKISITEKRYG